ncbi:DsbA family protein [Streptomyces sp. V1I1]|uniref:DsbA family protein n=1 Tax=Streptomyces sp. V1I1 TaxID=3042272 RepID=UPI002782C45E|nr:protein-disulfide isomerase [Streptomyces sp. V1I1]
MKQLGKRLLSVMVIGAVAWTSAGCGARSAPTVAAYAGLEELPEKLGVDGTTITVGDPDAPMTVRLYEDPRCPACEEFELTGAGPEVRSMTVRREAKTEYVLASFLDDRLGGSGSKKAVNALRAALDAGMFAEFHAVLYKNQPEEAVDGYTDAFLLELAGKVNGLRSASFDSAVKTMKYRSFVAASEEAYEGARVPGTPAAVINGTQVSEEFYGVLFDRSLFRMLIKEIRRDPLRWSRAF